MHSCPNCDSTSLQKRGTFALASGDKKQRYSCNHCGSYFSVETKIEVTGAVEEVGSTSKSRFIITSAKNGCETNLDFLRVLQCYSRVNDAELMVLPVRHKNFGEDYDPEFCPHIVDYLYRGNLDFPDHKVKILGALSLGSSVETPLSGIDAISKGSSLIIGHPQVQLKTLPRIHEKYPAILTTTGSVSKKTYTNTKSGIKAEFNHSYSAIVLELDNGFCHIRHLNYCENSRTIHDLGEVYTKNVVNRGGVDALVTGDEHVLFADPEVAGTTYTNPDSLLNVLRPKYIIRHDVLDCYSISHHHEKDFFTRFSKFKSGMCSVQDELDKTIAFINDTTPDRSISIIVQSNHNEHLYRWLNECDPKTQPWNAKLYHYLMFHMLDAVENDHARDPFRIYSQGKLKKSIKFIDRNDDFRIHDIQLSSHGDVGSNGARGSRKQFSVLPVKSIIGHSHSPGIEKGCYQVGTSSQLRLEYNSGASSWHHTHCLIHPNGKRQLVFITNGKYRL